MLNALDRASNRGRDALHAALDGVLEEVDVALPSGGPLGGLAGHALFGAWDAHGERGEGSDSGGAEADVLSHAGGGDADGHFGGLFWEFGLFDWKCCGLVSRLWL